MQTTSIFSLTDAGELLGRRLQQTMLAATSLAQSTEILLQHRPPDFIQAVQAAFSQGQRLVLICATGIAVRALAPVLEDKYKDPPVLVLDEQGLFVIPLLSGHEGGANEWARQVSEYVSGQLVITSAKPYLQPVYTVGMGCERGCDEAHLQALLDTCLAQQGLAIEAIASINSIAIKADEVGLIQLAKKHSKRFQTYSVEQLAQVHEQLAQPSDYVYQTVGVYGVAEAAALYAAQVATDSPAELVLTKQKTAKATCAIARAYPPGLSAFG